MTAPIRLLKRLAVITGCAFVVLVLHATGQVFLDRSAMAQIRALFIPDDSLVYQGRLISIRAQQANGGLLVSARATESVSLVKTPTQVLSGATVTVSLPAFAYSATLRETSTGLYQADAQVDVSVQPAIDGASASVADLMQWSVVPQSGTFTLGAASLSTQAVAPIKLADAMSKVDVLSQALGGLPPVTGFVPNAGISAAAAGATYQVPAAAVMRAQVLDGAGKPAANRRLTVTLAPNGLQTQTLAVTTDAQGFFDYNVTYPASISVTGGQLTNLPAPFQLQGTTTEQVSAFWWGGGDSGSPSSQQSAANLGAPKDARAAGGSDPVNIVTGNVYDTETDVAYSSPGLPISFQRTYNSQDTQIGVLGRGWATSFGLKIRQTQHDGVGTLTETTDQGGQAVWTQNGNDGAFTPPAGVHGTLTLDNGDKTYLKRDVHGVLTHYLTGDAGGMVDWVRDPNGNQTSFAYRGSQLTSVTDSAGRAVRLDYDGNGRLTSVTDPLGNATTYAYNSDGNLAEVDYPGGAKVHYGYDAQGNLVQITDPDGNHRNFTYDGQDRATSFSYDGGMEPTSFRYDTARQRTILTDAEGFQTTYSYQYVGSTGVITRIVDPMGHATSFTWDGDVNRTSATDPLNHTTKMTYDGQGNLTSTTDAAGAVIRTAYESIHNRVTARTDALGRKTSYGYDSKGNLVSVTDPVGALTQTVREGRGLALRQTDALGNSTALSYDSAGNLTVATDALGKTIGAAYDGLSHPTAITDALGRTSQLVYDKQYRVVKISRPDGAAMSIGYDPAGNVTSVTDPDGNTSKVAYDQADHAVRATDGLGRTTTVTYNRRGQVGTFADPAGSTTLLTYDPAGNQTKVIRPDGGFLLLTHDAAGRVTAMTDPDSHTTKYGYDADNRLTQTTDALGGVTKYSYDAAGERTSVVDANGHQTTSAYDARSRISIKTDALGRISKYSYDAAGNLASTVDALGKTTSYSYDALGRLLQAAYADGQTVKSSYDAAGNLAAMVDGQGTTTYTYDILNRLTQQVLPNGVTLGYTYDATGNRTSLSTPVGTTSYAYDAANEVTRVTDPLGGVDSFRYDPRGHVVGEAMANGTSSTTTYDAMGRVTHLTTSGPKGMANDLGYAYDKAGNAVVVTRNSLQTVLGYDALNRLVQVGYQGSAQVKYTYDAAGNRTTQVVTGASGSASGELTNGTTSYSYDAADELTSDSGHVYGYDADGQLVTSSSAAAKTTYTWDARHLLSSVQTPSHQVNYRYDGLGRMVARQDGSSPVTQNVYDGLQLLLQNQDPGNRQWTDFVGGNGHTLEALRFNSQDKPDAQAYFQYDAQGSLIAATNQSGNVDSSFAYTVWGSPADGGNSRSGAAKDGYRDVTYIGQPYDSAAGLSYLNARWYSPSSGRFLSRDPFPALAAVAGTLNRYVYGLNNPATFTDPTGLFVTAIGNGIATGASDVWGAITSPIGDLFNATLGEWFAFMGVADAAMFGSTAAGSMVLGSILGLTITFAVVAALYSLIAFGIAVYEYQRDCPGGVSGWSGSGCGAYSPTSLGLYLATAGLMLAILAFLIPPIGLILAIVGLILATIGLFMLASQLNKPAGSP